MISDMFAQITATQRCAFIGGQVQDNGETVLTGIAGAGAQQDIRQAAASHAVPGTIQWRVASAAPYSARRLNCCSLLRRRSARPKAIRNK